jgi:hypothetical protein
VRAIERGLLIGDAAEWEIRIAEECILQRTGVAEPSEAEKPCIRHETASLVMRRG